MTQKIIRAVKAGDSTKLDLGNLDVWRDWGWAPNYVQAMYLMLQQVEPKDYIIVTGVTHSLREFFGAAFTSVGLDAHDF